MTEREGTPIDQTVVQDEGELRRSKDRSEELPQPEVPGYDMKRRLGAGSYGEVWLAIQKNTGREVAIKFFSRYKGLDWPLLKREVGKLVEVLGERRVVHLLQVGWDAEPPYYVMEYLPGGSLADRLEGRTLSVKDTTAVFREVAEALVYLHGKAILHCDLKPANVLLDDHNQIRLADFGQARLSSDAGPAIGTLFYMAPEQTHSGARPDVRSDIYSLGALIYTMLTGQPPYSSETASDDLRTTRSTQERIDRYRKLIETAPIPVAHHSVPGVDRALGEIIDRCLKKDPETRYENVQQVLEALARRERQRTQRPLVVFGLLGPLLLVLAMAGVGIWVWFRAESQASSTLTAQSLESAHGYGELISTVVDRNLSAVQRRVRREAESPELARLVAAGGSAALQRHMEGLYDAYRDRFFHNWVVTNDDALALARAPYSERVVGSRYAYREWFSGKEDVPPDQAPQTATPRRATGVTLAFESTAEGNPVLVSVASPIVADGRTVGVLAATVHLETFNAWLEQAEGHILPSGCPSRFAILVNRGQLVRHPCPSDGAPRPPVDRETFSRSDDVGALITSPDGLLERYRDPLRDGMPYLAAYVPFQENADWAAFVQQDMAVAMSPITGLAEEFGALGRIAAAAAVLLVGVSWALLFRVTRERALARSRRDLIELDL